MNIRLVNIPAGHRFIAIKCVAAYEKDHLHDGRQPGMRHGVVWLTDFGTYYVYHTKTTIAVNFQAKEVEAA